jgi:two-component system response regulator AtoC
MKPLKIFIVDDEDILRIAITDDLRDAGFKVYDYPDALSALNDFENIKPDIIFSDIKMPEMNGIQFLSELKKRDANIIIVLMTSYGSVESAVEAMKLGAYDYITKPFNNDEIILIIERIKEYRLLNTRLFQFNSELRTKYDFSTFVGKSEIVKNIFNTVKKVLFSNTTILISGETGTGKELLANIIHFNSDRSNKPMIKVSCAILSREIFESELFGHEKGAFTGAHKEKQGRFELADTGTIYLDDVDDIPFDLQVKLLRVLELQEFEKVGSSEPVNIDVRVIASTKVDLRKLVNEGKFREDLYYRLNVFPIHINPLRERKEDIPELIKYFSQDLSNLYEINIDKDVINILCDYNWPGNVRELKNLIERLILISENGNVNISKIPTEINNAYYLSNQDIKKGESLEEILTKVEINAIKFALVQSGGNKTRAAEILKLPLSTLRSKMDKYFL